MTSTTLKTGLISLAILGLSLPAASAMAADVAAHATQSYVVKSAADARIQNGAKAFKRGQLDRSIMYSNAAIKAGMSPRRTAIAHSNLCAAHAAKGELAAAKEACDAALTLRPGYAPAQSNKAALTYRLAQK